MRRFDLDDVSGSTRRRRKRSGGSVPVLRGTLRETMTALERELLVQTLERHGWKMSETARELGLERSHLYKKLKAHEIEKPGRLRPRMCPVVPQRAARMPQFRAPPNRIRPFS